MGVFCIGLPRIQLRNLRMFRHSRVCRYISTVFLNVASPGCALCGLGDESTIRSLATP